MPWTVNHISEYKAWVQTIL